MTAATVTLSVGPHQDATGLAIQEVPEAEALVPLAVLGLVGSGMLMRVRRRGNWSPAGNGP